MKLIEVTWQHRFDFDGILQCEHCGGFQSMKNGYDDYRFHAKVLPAIKCESCGLRGVSPLEISEEINDPGFQGGVALKKEFNTVEVWVLK